ncbi:MAG: ATP-dependent DNA helicase RecG [Eubacteriales bacterium]|nr:ATP-dependent DNA helicase RecG [Eubacteriales bacterium]
MADLLDTPVTALNGVAGKRAALLKRLGISSWLDLMTWYPRAFEDWSSATPIDQLQDGIDQTFTAALSGKVQSHRKGRLTITRAVFRDESAAIRAVWFNQPWVADKLKADQSYRLFGRVKRRDGEFSIQSPSLEVVEADSKGKIRPIYPTTEGLSQGVLRSLILPLLQKVMTNIPEPLPFWVRKKHHLCAIDYAIARIHQPESLDEVEIARNRLVFEELFLLQSGLYLLRRARQNSQIGIPIHLSAALHSRVMQTEAQLPFQLTAAQVAAIAAIRRDLQTDRPMNRLIQGDVGSGKTVIAALAMLEVALSGHQAVMMAPTAILANQHQQTLEKLLAGSGEPVALLTGATPAAKRREILKGLADNTIRLLVGTHAVIEDKVELPQLALTITDEQHRFGVRQRIRLSRSEHEKTVTPHVLVMSATPIPRTLALILYGDLDMTLIDQLPAGREPIKTYTARSGDRERVENLIRKQVAEGRQIYVVCPMIEEQESVDLESAVQTYNRLAQDVFPDLSVGLIHGGLKSSVKDQIMLAFNAGELSILVSTTVIEVGVDNPNASLMMIENAERFGLAQLHQLRGRIGRGPHKSICILMSDTDDELARERLRTLCQTTDGFVLAQKDLELRGPGDFFGTRQHGLPDLRLANLYRDREVLVAAQETAQELFLRDPDLTEPEHLAMARALIRRFGETFQQIQL